ncbi:hypothetical protein [Comamonas sp. JC664]|uniref:hypothetical protein n=1 Tax=Comamonas sp. JC664 TaxID=2801917 RepID=UPI00174B7C9C|nr:hypothetical protein [Comamonas sp. JC664]MBL0692151.1 hypothetical protein [Comamonas sp. JC664]GHG99621.1 hypothetical protein GCM10012319_66130 [Comamonas sp. KCTC 72670]
MSSRRHSLSWGVALLLTLTASAAGATEPTASVSVLAEQSACAQAVESDARSTGDEGDLSSLVCVTVRCSSDQDCVQACPTARTATCSRNACSYTYGGGGGGGGGSPCPSTRCMYDEDCVCRGVQGYCNVRACAY